MRPSRFAALSVCSDAVGITATPSRVFRAQGSHANNRTKKQSLSLVLLLAVIALAAPLIAYAELTAALSFYSVNAPFDSNDCDLLDSYLTQLLLDKNVPIVFDNPSVYRTNCSFTNTPSARVKSILSYIPIFDGLGALVSGGVWGEGNFHSVCSAQCSDDAYLRKATNNLRSFYEIISE